jgi:type I restriction enzyme S subunit
MSVPAYPSYRDSAVEWLGEVPSHWEVRRIKLVAKLNPSKTEVADLPDDVEVSFLPMEAIGEDGAIDLTRTRAVSEVRNGYSYFADGDVVFAKVTPCLENGKGALMRGLLGGRGFGTTELTVLRPRSPVDGPYLRWVTFSRVFRGPAEGEMVGAGGLKRVPDDFVADFRVAWPPEAERVEIAAFLDRETAKIDALVEAQRRLIELLKEKRQAVISHAVTKGLDRTAPMKDSGIEWLGEVPAHWKVAPLKRVVPGITVGIVVEPSKYYVNEGVPALRSLNVRPGSINQANMIFISEAAHELHIKSRLGSGDVVVVRTGQPGTAAIVPDELDGANCIDLIIVRRSEELSEKFLCWFLASDAARQQFVEGSGGAIQLHFNVGAANQLMLSIPPSDEQMRIVYKLDHHICDLDDLVVASQRAIQLLQERRAALISAAVTGKIDVRNAVREAEAA